MVSLTPMKYVQFVTTHQELLVAPECVSSLYCKSRGTQLTIGRVLTCNLMDMLTFLDALVIFVSKHMVFCLGLVFVILLYGLDCSLITVCSCMAVLCGLLIVGKLNA